MNFLKDINFWEYFKEEKDDDEDSEPHRTEGEFVPIFGVCKAVSHSLLRNDGTKKSQREIDAIGFNKQMYKFSGGSNYEHALVSFDIELREMYSFEENGIQKDNIEESESWMGTRAMYVCVMFLPKKDIDRMRKYVDHLIEHKEETSYAFGNIIEALTFWDGTRPLKTDKRFFCSSFTAFIMHASNKKNIHRDFSRMQPEDITILPRSFFLTVVKDRKEYHEKLPELREKVKQIFDDNEEAIREYNNDLPKLKLKNIVMKRRKIDDILDYIVDMLKKDNV